MQVARVASLAALNAFQSQAYQLPQTPIHVRAADITRTFRQWQGPLDQSVSSGNGTNESKLTVETLMGISANSKGDIQVLESAFIFNLLAWIGIIIAFCVLLRIYPLVYTRLVKGEKIGDSHPATTAEGFFAKVVAHGMWLNEVYRMTDHDVIKASGLDGFCYLEYLKMMRWICCVLTPVIVCCLCPMHVIFGMNNDEVDKLSRLGINNLPQGSQWFWMHVLYVYYVVIIVVGFVLKYQHSFVKKRYEWLADLPPPQCRTVLITNIPWSYRSDKNMTSFCKLMFGEDMVERAYVIRRTGNFYKMDSMLNSLKDKLVRAEASGDKKAVEEALEKIDIHEDKMNAEREKFNVTVDKHEEKMPEKSIEEHVQTTGPEETKEGVETNLDSEDVDKHAFSASAFVTFTSKQQAGIALSAQLSENRDEFVVSSAPDPKDVNYANLALLPDEQENLDFIGRCAILGIFFTWLPCVLTLTSLTSLQSLQEHIPLVRSLCESQPALQPIMEGILSTAALQLFMALLPVVMGLIIQQFFYIRADTDAQYHLHSWIFAFDLFFVVLVTAIGRSIFITAKQVASDTNAVFELLALGLPASSHFYLQYVVLGWFGVAFEQLRIMNLLKYVAFRAFKTPEEAKEMSESAWNPMGLRFANTTISTAILLTFCTCSPLICVFSWIYFNMCSITYTYLLCKVEYKKPDLGGAFWVQGLKQTFVGLTVFVTLMVGILEERAYSFKPGVVASGAYALIYWGYGRLEQVHWETRSLPAIVLEDKTGTPKDPVGEYIDPVLQQAEKQAEKRRQKEQNKEEEKEAEELEQKEEENKAAH